MPGNLGIIASGHYTAPSPSFRSAASTRFAAGSSSVSVTKPSGTVDGDVMLAWGRINGIGPGQSITPPAGWTQLQNSNNLINGYLWTKTASSEGASYSFTTTTGQPGRVSIASFSASTGVDTSTVAEDTTNVTSHSATGLTPSVNNCLIVYLIVFGGVSNSMTPPTGYTERQDTIDANAPQTSCADLAQTTAAATGTVTGTSANAINAHNFLVALKP